MFKTRITELLGIQYPVIGGTMMYLSYPELTAAISEAGALGILASANYKQMPQFRDALKQTKDLTDKPFAVNLNMFPAIQQADNNLYLDEMEREGIKIVETSGHKAPDDLVGRIHDAGMLLIHKCVAPRYARKAESVGVDAVAVVGWENGGATGVLDLATSILIPRTVDSVSLPLIGGGGVGDGRGLAAMLALGADAAIIGTLLLSAEEAKIHPRVREELIRLQEHETTLILRSLHNTHRVADTEVAHKVQQMEEEQADIEQLLPLISGAKSQALWQDGNLDAGVLWLGQAVGFIKEIRPIKVLIEEMAQQAEQSLKRMRGLFGAD
ncbi:MAG: nitronate monooxygenase [Candidatus Alcyoniella australis]|nr:nitronate monooxygenase [Candidatus Alcyoniella australis]